MFSITDPSFLKAINNGGNGNGNNFQKIFPKKRKKDNDKIPKIPPSDNQPLIKRIQQP